MIVRDDDAASERRRELVDLTQAERRLALELPVLESERWRGTVGVVRPYRPHLERHGALEHGVVPDVDVGADVEVLVAVAGEGARHAGVHAGAGEHGEAGAAEVLVTLHLHEGRLVDGLVEERARRHVLIVDADGQAGFDDVHVELGDGRVHDQLSAIGGGFERFDVARVEGDRLGLGAPDLVGNGAGTSIVYVAEDDLAHCGALRQVPSDHMSLRAGADDENLHAKPPVLWRAQGRLHRRDTTEADCRLSTVRVPRQGFWNPGTLGRCQSP